MATRAKPEPACENCAYWRGNQKRRGDCRRRAPTNSYRDFGDDLIAEWPMTTASQWCGEHEPRK